MERRRAIMIDTKTGQPIDPDWQPMLLCDELEPANELMATNRLTFRWEWIPMVIALQGVITAGG